MDPLLADFLSSPSVFIVFFLSWAVPIVIYALYRRRGLRERARSVPLGIFLRELTSGSTAGFDRRFLGMFHPAVFKRVEKGVIRAMSRCVTAKYGRFVAVDDDSVELRVRSGTTSAVAKVNFERAEGVLCQAAWVLREGDPHLRFQIVGFNVAPLRPEDFDVLSYIVPEEFAPFGQRFISALLSQDISTAIRMMVPSLQEKYKDEESRRSLGAEVTKVLRACGGMRHDSDVDTTMVDGRLVRVGGSEKARASGVELEFAVLGKIRDMRVAFKVVFVDLQCFVIKYQIVVQAPANAPKHVIYDQNTAESIVIG
jgi:hypothetical protein